ncbi:MAG: hypothetical protein ACWA44_11445 [Thiotrichales bacterium]
MNTQTDVNGERLKSILSKLAPVMLPPADYPPATIVRDTPRQELLDRIAENAQSVNLSLTDKHMEVINFLFDFYANCCEAEDPGYLSQKTYWKYVDCTMDPDCEPPVSEGRQKDCPYGELDANEATNAYRVYRVLLKAFEEKGGSKYLYQLFPYGPVFTIHLLAQLPRLRNDADPHFGTAY